MELIKVNRQQETGRPYPLTMGVGKQAEETEKMKKAKQNLLKTGLIKGFEAQEDIEADPQTLRFEGNPIRYFDTENERVFYIGDILKASGFWATVPADMLLLTYLNELPKNMPELKDLISIQNWYAKPTSAFFYRLDCLNTEGVVLLLEKLNASQIEVFKNWWNSQIIEKIKV